MPFIGAERANKMAKKAMSSAPVKKGTQGQSSYTGPATPKVMDMPGVKKGSDNTMSRPAKTSKK